MKKSNNYSDGDDLGPMLCCERWLLDSKSDPIIFFLATMRAGAGSLVHKDVCNKTTRSQESTDRRLEGADFQRVVEN